MFWCKYKPKTLEDFNYNIELISKLNKLVKNYKKDNNLLNLAFYGISDSGKLTLSRCFLASLFGTDIHNLREEIYVTKQNCTSYSIKIFYSKYHFEISLCGLQYADKSVLIDILNKYFSTIDINNLKYKILIIRDFDKLSIPAQLSLRRKMEQNIFSVRFIFILKSLNKMESALTSRVFLIRCRPPYESELKTIIKKIIDSENISVSEDQVNEIIEKSNGNLGKIIYYLYLLYKNDKSKIVNPEEDLINDYLKCLDERNPPLKRIRDILSQIQLSKIYHINIFKRTLLYSFNFIKNPDNRLICIENCAKYQNISQKTNKFIICIESFIILIFILKDKDKDMNTEKNLG